MLYINNVFFVLMISLFKKNTDQKLTYINKCANKNYFLLL